MVLVDALLYAQHFWPKFIVDVATLSDHILEGIGKPACGIFTNSEEMWLMMRNASIHTGDRVWRLPLWNYFTQQMTNSKSVDLQVKYSLKNPKP